MNDRELARLRAEAARCSAEAERHFKNADRWLWITFAIYLAGQLYLRLRGGK